jgi:hypothetical protein
MPNFHIEVHSKDRVIEHYILPDCEGEGQARERIEEFYKDKGFPLAQSLELAMQDSRFQYYIFRVVRLGYDPVIYIAGEYRSPFPV